MKKARAIWLGAGLLAAAAAVLASTGASARVEADSDYSKAQTYNGALRYVRVDLGYEIVEKDPDVGYFLFRYEPPGRKNAPTSGSIEVIESKERVKVVVQLPQMPTYHETTLRDGLMKKLRTEYGEPVKKKKDRDKDKPPEADGGVEGGSSFTP
ncbi:MAG: hypothetical protein IT377_08050 [Polyangiaceae bacterium]|nr:hypothetical protein [Myxococcales bacterium]MCC6898913.1 hypothetical protein [Polyangiaceae bacterium]